MIDIKQEKDNKISIASYQQNLASNPLKSVWVEASAGTGKTKVLSDRVLRLLLNGVQPSKILCLTYTKAAAVEMNTRIAGRLSKWAVEPEDELSDELQKLLGVLPNKEVIAASRKLFAKLLDATQGLKIQTIHSFCQEVLKRFPIEAKISPYFEVMDDRTAKEVLDILQEKLLQKIEQEPDSKAAQSLGYITANISEFVFPKIMNSITANRNKIQRLFATFDSVDELVFSTAEKLGIDESDNAEDLVANYFISFDRDKLKSIMEALAQSTKTDQDRALVLANNLSGLIDYDSFKDVFFLKGKNEVRAKLAAKKAVEFCPDVVEFCLDIADELLALENKIASISLFKATKSVLYLAEDLILGYNNYKKNHSKMDYEDLIVITRKLLESREVADWVLYKLDGGIDNVLIDEAQDTSPDQWAIVKAIVQDFFAGNSTRVEPRTVFVVGDRKQSIYSFQGADPAEFEKMRQYFVSKSEDFMQVRLDVSFRSTAAILEMVDNLFLNPIASKGVVLNGEYAAHSPSRIGEAGKVELWPLMIASKDENPDVWRTPVEREVAASTSSRLAKQIAQNIKKMVSSGEQLESKGRAIKYKDFMVLVRRRNSFVEELVRECKNIGVEIAGVDRIKLLEQIAVQDLLTLGKFLLLPSDDLSLAEVLKSPIFGLTDDDLFTLCYKRKSSLWNSLLYNDKYKPTSEILQNLLNIADYIRPFELYSYVLNVLGGYKKFVSRIGIDALDGIDEFLNLAINFEREHIPTLQNFVDWVRKDEVEIKRELEQSDIDAVRIMTVHGSKGLQAPIVVLPDTVSVKVIKNDSELLLDDYIYYPFSAKDYEDNCKGIKDKQKESNIDEYRRLLYVALTRAEERLCICGFSKSEKINEDSWYNLCQQTFSDIATKQEDGTLSYEVEQKVAVKKDKDVALIGKKDLMFAWVSEQAPVDAVLSKPLRPSQLEDDGDVEVVSSPLSNMEFNPYSRGKIIHKLLQILPDIDQSKRQKILEEYLNNNAPELNKNRIKNEVLGLIANPQFAEIFSNSSKAEVAVMGQVDGKIISGQIDRLVVGDDKVFIVDYKTNRPAATKLEDVPSLYIKQMNAYKVLIEDIYPDKEVKCYILWTDIAQLMEIF